MYSVFKPKSEILQQYISEFTILNKNNFKPTRYLALPHSKAAISLFNKSSVIYNEHQLDITNDKSNSPSVYILGKYTSPILLDYKGAVDEIAINFKTLGINYFFEDNFDKIASKPVQILTDNGWNEFSTQLYNIEEDKRIDSLENFLLLQIKHKKLTQIESIIKTMESDKSLKIKDIASELNISVRTINRLFHRYIGFAPKDFKRIIRFRSALKMNVGEISLTELCLNNDYYDSPHFTNEFRLLTNKNPRDFFNSMSEIGDEKFPYVFL
ncbi:MAG: helix-turn-helix domain-containing protein [Crocinitomicaceae bacterium]